MRAPVLAVLIASLIGSAAQAQLKPLPLLNVFVVEIGGVGPGLPDAFGGEVHTPTLARVAAVDAGYERVDEVDLGPTRLATALLGRGYDSAAFGRWGREPAAEGGPEGPFDGWPTRQGFGSFYGFLAGEASQYHPGLVRDTELVSSPRTPAQGYYLSADLADEAIAWLRRHRFVAPDRPFLVYFAPGAGRGPQQVPRPWADAYRGRFDDGWDAYRDRVFERAQQAGWFPAGARPDPRPQMLAAWDSIPEAERPFQRRLMEVLAGYLENADASAGRVLSEIERLGYGDDTLVIYRWGDGFAPAEDGQGVISAMLARNEIPSRPAHHIGALERMGGLGLLGGPKVENRAHAAWAWAASQSYQGRDLAAARPGRRHRPIAVAWPARIRAGAAPRGAPDLARDLGSELAALLEIPRIREGMICLDPLEPEPRPPSHAQVDWLFTGAVRRLPEVVAPPVGSRANTVEIEVDVAANASGVLYALGGIGGGVTAYLDGGTLAYEYNIFEIQRVKIRSKEKLAAGRRRIQIETGFGSDKPRAPARVTLSVDGRQVASGVVAITAPFVFSTFETFDVGADLGSPVSLDYFDRAPFALEGSIERLEVRAEPSSR
ncbi:MAG TPA: sulfatase-like hydrolase/transferase [Myxococcota bacterium]